jgi:Flp pilus assembly protein TadG
MDRRDYRLSGYRGAFKEFPVGPNIRRGLLHVCRSIPLSWRARSLAMTLKLPRRQRRDGSRVHPGQAMVEFAFASMVFLTIVFGTIDFGRAIFIAGELHNAAREGARYGKVSPADTPGIRQRAVDKAAGTGLTTGNVGVSCTGACKNGDTLTVTTQVQFQAVTQQLLGISPFTISSSSTVDIE